MEGVPVGTRAASQAGGTSWDTGQLDPCYPAQTRKHGHIYCLPSSSLARTSQCTDHRYLGTGVTHTLSSLRNHRRFEACMPHGGVALIPLLQALLATGSSMLQLSIGPRSGACKCGMTSGWDVPWQQEDRGITGHGPTGCMQALQVMQHSADLRFWAMGSYTFMEGDHPRTAMARAL